jgi:hypothetical protein
MFRNFRYIIILCENSIKINLLLFIINIAMNNNKISSNTKIGINNKSINDSIKVEMVTTDQMSDAERNSVFNREASVDAIPDIDVLTSHVYEILEYIKLSSTQKLMETNDCAVKMYLNNKYADTVPLGIITILMEKDQWEEHIPRLLNMFDVLKSAKKGNLSLDDAQSIVANDVKQRYVGSDADFEKAMAKNLMSQNQNGGNIKNIGKMKIKN